MTAELYTILHVVDGAPTLLGFADRRERDLARRLMTVSGVGPAVTLAVLSTYSPGQIARAILDGEAAAFKRVKGVGARIAERLCLELRDEMARSELAGDLAPADGDPVVLPRSSEDAVAALITLGYSAKDARARVEKALQPGADTEQLVRAVLRG